MWAVIRDSIGTDLSTVGRLARAVGEIYTPKSSRGKDGKGRRKVVGWETGEKGEGSQRSPGGWRCGRLIARRSMSCLALSFCRAFRLPFPCPRRGRLPFSQFTSISTQFHVKYLRYCHSQVPSSVRSRIRELSSTGYCWYLAGSSWLLSCAALLGWSPEKKSSALEFRYWPDATPVLCSRIQSGAMRGRERGRKREKRDAARKQNINTQTPATSSLFLLTRYYHYHYYYYSTTTTPTIR